MKVIFFSALLLSLWAHGDEGPAAPPREHREAEPIKERPLRSVLSPEPGAGLPPKPGFKGLFEESPAAPSAPAPAAKKEQNPPVPHREKAKDVQKVPG